MIMDGCQGKPRTPTIEDRICPNCGNPIEIFSTDTEVACDKCGFVDGDDGPFHVLPSCSRLASSLARRSASAFS